MNEGGNDRLSNNRHYDNRQCLHNSYGEKGGDIHRQKFFMIGDMVQVTDDRHAAYGKFGLVEALNPAGGEWQIVIKIGRDSCPAFFRQARFCTRINRTINKSFGGVADGYSKRERTVDSMIDCIDEDDDNQGNR